MSFPNLYSEQSGVFIGNLKKELVEDDDSNQPPQEKDDKLDQSDELNLPDVLLRTVSDLQDMKEKYTTGLSAYNRILDAMAMSEEIEVAKQMMNTGLEIHVSLLNYIKDACQLVGVETDWIDIKEEPDFNLVSEMAGEVGFMQEMIEVKTELTEPKTDLSPQEYLDQLKAYFKVSKKKQSEERPHQCDQCDKRYKRKTHLNEHKRSKHSNNLLDQLKEDRISQYMGVSSLFVPEDFKGKIVKKEEMPDETDPALDNLKSENGEAENSSEKEAESGAGVGAGEGNEEGAAGEGAGDGAGVGAGEGAGEGNLKKEKKIAKPHKEKPYLCLLCNRTFFSQKGLRVHVEQVHVNPVPSQRSTERKYACVICPLKFQKQSALLIHLKTHQCRFCGQQFNNKKDKRLHMNKEHFKSKKKEPSQYICSTCGYTSMVRKNFQLHIKIHEEKEHCCPYCQKRFTHKYGLVDHIRIHTGEKPCECQVCGMRFRTYSGLTQHKIIHTGVKPFECEVCGKGFTQKGNLKTHMKSHTSGNIPPIIKPDSPYP